MAVIDVYNTDKEKTSEMELREDIFQVPVKNDVLHQVVVGQLASHRAGSASTKGRSEVIASGSKLYRQKGTGRARSGAASSPIRRGGGVAFGPKPRKYARRVPKRVRKAALKMALTEKFQNDRLVVLQDFDLAETKTKAFVRVMENFDVKKALIVTENKNENLEKSSRNVSWVKVMRHEGLNVLDVIRYEHLFLVQPAINRIEEALVS